MEIEDVQEILRKEFPQPQKIYCYGIPVEEFDKEDLIRLLALSNRTIAKQCEARNRMAECRMQKMFVGARG